MVDVRNSIKLESVGALVVGVRDRWLPPFPGQILKANVILGTAGTGASVNLDIKKNGVSIFTAAAPAPSIAAGATTAFVTPDLTLGKFTTNDVITFEVLQVGATVAGSDADATIEYLAS